MFCIDAAALGAPAHLLFDDSGDVGEWVTERPAGVPTFSGTLKRKSCLDTMLKLASSRASLSFPSEYDKVAAVFCKTAYPMWSMMLPKSVFRDCVRAFAKSVAEARVSDVAEYYETTWERVGDFLSSFGQLAAPGLPAAQVMYNRLATRTGRLTVASGAQVLTMPRDSRKDLRCSEPGELFYVDFRALEPTIIANVVGAAFEGSDLYSWLSDRVMRSRDRDAAKRAVVAALYGSQSCRSTDAQRIASWFKLDELASRIRALSPDGVRVVNLYGRMIMSDDFTNDGCVINDYAQSSAVDAAALGFAQMCAQTGVKPLAMIHDAVIVRDELGTLQEGFVGKIDVERAGALYYKISRLGS